MKTYAKFVSKNTKEGIKIFRHHTEFHSVNGPGEVIGLVVMMNPGDARPISDELFNNLKYSEFKTEGYIPTKPDKTMKKVIRLIEVAYETNKVNMPEKYTIHVENLFNIREKNSSAAKKLANRLCNVEDLMFKARTLNHSYNFVFFAWGNVNINNVKQNELMINFPNAIRVNTLNHKGKILDVNYPVHPLYMNTEYFIESSRDKII
jgi:hypothetical protein